MLDVSDVDTLVFVCVDSVKDDVFDVADDALSVREDALLVKLDAV
jgi:hypothetical protein